MSWLYVISSNDAETVFNAVRLANTGLKAGREINLFMLGKGVEFNEISTEEFDVKAQVEEFYNNGGELFV